MNLFTIEIAGRPVLVFPEASSSAAEALATTEIGPDLMEFEAEGEPLWNGDEEALAVRASNADEVARWEMGRAEIQMDGASPALDPESYAVFLVDLDEEEAEA